MAPETRGSRTGRVKPRLDLTASVESKGQWRDMVEESRETSIDAELCIQHLSLSIVHTLSSH